MCTIAISKCDERKIRIQVHRPRQRLQPLLAPGGVRQPELVAPVARLERDRATCRSQRLGRAAARSSAGTTTSRALGEIALELDRAPHVIDGPRQQPAVRLVARARHLVLPEARVGEADVRRGVARIELDRLLEVGDRRRHLRRIERLEPDASFRERVIRLEAARVAERSRLAGPPPIRSASENCATIRSWRSKT